MLNSHTQHSVFKHLLSNVSQDNQKEYGIDKLCQPKALKWTAFTPSDEIISALKPALSSLEMSVETSTPRMESTSQWTHAGKHFSPFSKHKGNSLIQFQSTNQTRFGKIKHIIRLIGQPNVIFVVQPFMPLEGPDIRRSPYHSFPLLKATVLYDLLQTIECIMSNNIFGHCALRKNPPGSFKISQPTVSLVSLRSMVRSYFTSTSVHPFKSWAIYTDPKDS